MSIVRATRFLLLLAVAFAAGCSRNDAGMIRSAAEGGKIVMGVTLGGPPYTYRDETDGSIAGIDIDLAKAGAAKLGLEMEFREMEFQDLLPAVKSGAIDCAGAAITITPNRARDVDFSEAYASDGCAFLYRSAEKRPTMTSGSAFRIATQDASSSQIYLCAHGLDPIVYATYEDCFKAIESGDVQTVFYDAAPIRETVEKSGGKYAISPLETRECYGIAVRKDFTELTKAIDEATREWRRMR